jgi:ethanolamine utilization microcompartment shell protein EutL
LRTKNVERAKTHTSLSSFFFLFLLSLSSFFFLLSSSSPTTPGQSLERITADTDRDFFMSAEEAVDYGLVDAVVSRPYFSSDIPFSAKQAARSAAVVGGDESEAKKAPGNRAARVLLPKALGGDRVLAFAVTERAKELGLEASADAIKKAEKELPTFAPIIQRTVGDIAQYTGRISGNRRAADAAADAAIKAFSEMDELKDGQEPTDKKVASPAIALGIKAMNESLVEQGGRAILRPQDIVKEDPEVKMKRNEFLKKRAESMRAGRE